MQAMMARKHSMEAYKAEISVLKAQIKEASGLVARSLKPIQLVLFPFSPISHFLTQNPFFLFQCFFPV